MASKSVSNNHRFFGRVEVHRGISYKAKITWFKVQGDLSNYAVGPTGEIVSSLNLGPNGEIAWVDVEFKVLSSRSSMRKTFEILTKFATKRLFALEAPKYAKKFVSGLKDPEGKKLRLVFKPQKMYTTHVNLVYDKVGCPLAATVRIESQRFANLN